MEKSKEENKKNDSRYNDSRYNEFLKYLQKRMKELENEEKKFREAIVKEKKVN